MKDIKFRAWDKVQKTMRHATLNQAANHLFYSWIDTDNIMQYTGLKDKNGKGIYEGDIVSFGKYVYTIIYEIGGFNLCDKEGLMIGKIGGNNDHVYPLQVLYLDCCWEENSAFDIEVIGNIYENPELLRAVI